MFQIGLFYIIRIIRIWTTTSFEILKWYWFYPVWSDQDNPCTISPILEHCVLDRVLAGAGGGVCLVFLFSSALKSIECHFDRFSLLVLSIHNVEESSEMLSYDKFHSMDYVVIVDRSPKWTENKNFSYTYVVTEDLELKLIVNLRIFIRTFNHFKSLQCQSI